MKEKNNTLPLFIIIVNTINFIEANTVWGILLTGTLLLVGCFLYYSD